MNWSKLSKVRAHRQTYKQTDRETDRETDAIESTAAFATGKSKRYLRYFGSMRKRRDRHSWNTVNLQRTGRSSAWSPG